MKAGEERCEQQALPSTFRVLVFFVLVALMPGLADWVFGRIRQPHLSQLTVDSGLYRMFVIPPLAFVFWRRSFSARLWQIPPAVWKSVLAIAAVQIVMNHLPVHAGPLSKYRAIGALAFAPLWEELVRAVMLFPLKARWGRVISVLAIGALFATIHEFPLYALAQQTALTITLLWSESIPANAAAHFVMNCIVIEHYGIG